MAANRFCKPIVVLFYLTLVAVIALSGSDYKCASVFGWLGIALTLLGILIIFWAKETAGRFYCFTPEIDEPVLLENGLYGVVRHPQYTGSLIALLGLAIAAKSVLGAIIWALVALPFHVMRALKEEDYLKKRYGRKYEAWRNRVGFMLPRLSTISRILRGR